MFRIEILRLVRRVLILAILTTGLALAASGLVGNNAGAAICCEQCFVNFDNCLNNCSDNQQCIAACNTTLNSCHRYCDSLC